MPARPLATAPLGPDPQLFRVKSRQLPAPSSPRRPPPRACARAKLRAIELSNPPRFLERSAVMAGLQGVRLDGDLENTSRYGWCRLTEGGGTRVICPPQRPCSATGEPYAVSWVRGESRLPTWPPGAAPGHCELVGSRPGVLLVRGQPLTSVAFSWMNTRNFGGGWNPELGCIHTNQRTNAWVW